MAHQQIKRIDKLERIDPVWTRIRQEAEAVVRAEPELGSFIYGSILHHDTLEQAVVHRIAERLDRADVSGELIRQAYGNAIEDEPSLGEAFRADIVAVFDRDPATNRGTPAYATASVASANRPTSTSTAAASPSQNGPKPRRRRAPKPNVASATANSSVASANAHGPSSRKPSPSDGSTLA